MSTDKIREPEPTELEAIEARRLTHVENSLKKALPESLQGEPEIEKALSGLAQAAIESVDRFPGDGWPFEADLNTAPGELHPSTARSIDEIDAAVFSGDAFHATESHLFLAAHVQRWSKALRLQREDDNHNRPQDPDDDEGLSP